MKKCLLIPTIVFPYFMMSLFLLFFFVGEKISDQFSGWFLDHIGAIGIGILLWILLAVVLNTVFLLKNKNSDATDVLKAAILVKCLHIPVYVMFFLFGLLLVMMFFMTMPLILLVVLIDYVTLWLSNMLSLAAIIKGFRQFSTEFTTPLVVSLICQFFFCADIISLFVLSANIRKKAISSQG